MASLESDCCAGVKWSSSPSVKALSCIDICPRVNIWSCFFKIVEEACWRWESERYHYSPCPPFPTSILDLCSMTPSFPSPSCRLRRMSEDSTLEPTGHEWGSCLGLVGHEWGEDWFPPRQGLVPGAVNEVYVVLMARAVHQPYS